MIFESWLGCLAPVVVWVFVFLLVFFTFCLLLVSEVTLFCLSGGVGCSSSCVCIYYVYLLIKTFHSLKKNNNNNNNKKVNEFHISARLWWTYWDIHLNRAYFLFLFKASDGSCVFTVPHQVLTLDVVQSLLWRFIYI